MANDPWTPAGRRHLFRLVTRRAAGATLLGALAALLSDHAPVEARRRRKRHQAKHCNCFEAVRQCEAIGSVCCAGMPDFKERVCVDIVGDCCAASFIGSMNPYSCRQCRAYADSVWGCITSKVTCDF